MSPVLSAIGLTLFSVTIVGTVTLVRWWLSKTHWDHHPQGREGHLKDAVLMTATFTPMIIAALIFRIAVLSHPNAPPSPFLFAGLVAAFALRVALRRFPPFAPASQRLTDCRMSALAAKQSSDTKVD